MEILDNFLKTKKIPHALVFSGRDFSYLKEQAYLFASKILLSDVNATSSKIKNRQYHGIYEYYPKGKLYLHSIETIRLLIADVWKPNFDSLFKVFLIYSADRMLPSAVTALLKVFEEPEKNVVIILISQRIEKLPAAILSRSVVISFKQKSHNYEIDEVQEEFFSFIKENLFSFSEIGDFYQKIEVISKKKELESFMNQEIKNILEIIYLCFRDKFLLDKEIQKLLNFPDKVDIIRLLAPIPIEKVYLVIQQATEALNKGTSKKFILEWVFLQIEKLFLHYLNQ